MTVGVDRRYASPCPVVGCEVVLRPGPVSRSRRRNQYSKHLRFHGIDFPERTRLTDLMLAHELPV